ncbi:hypothetical protein MmiEs2_00220 [Methanimicrococcus stummii]|uniref:Uncharacterized protein n=1 Tax=Methanimicrococcus stummii TaxID=3028294 RepID=A0AA96V707_9EURY|nr:hypothetical protein [Methanimicrococcus sp. Es2]WNY27849.1 hypothetical protein MmiEs2_00220 [Methanimicrococcus sp. Es2]
MNESYSFYRNSDFQNPFFNCIAEDSAKYEILKSCYRRNDLSAAEKISVGNYQDVHEFHFQKTDWNIELPEIWKNKPYCYVINSYCRNSSFFESLSLEEQSLVRNKISNIDRAISKSRLQASRFVYRGVSLILIGFHAGRILI